MMGQLAGQVGIITGGGSGIGAATARELAALGARLVIGDIASIGAAHVVADIVVAGGDAVFVSADVRRFEDMEHLRDMCLDRYGCIDFVVANAGIADTSSMSSGDPQRWRNVIETNVLGTAYTVRAILPVLSKQGSGHIVLVASVSGREVYVGEPIYLASKWAMVGLGRALRKEVLDVGVRVTLIEPGLVDTPLARSNPLAQEWFQRFQSLRAEDVAHAIAYTLQQPPYMAVNEIVLRSLSQEV